MKRYRITFELELNDGAGHPRKWVPDAVWQGLEPGEDILDWNFVELPEAKATVIDVEATWIEP